MPRMFAARCSSCCCPCYCCGCSCCSAVCVAGRHLAYCSAAAAAAVAVIVIYAKIFSLKNTITRVKPYQLLEAALSHSLLLILQLSPFLILTLCGI